MDIARLKSFVGSMWDDSVVPTITDYIRVPNKSPAFDPEWEAHGHMDKAVALFEAWAKEKIADRLANRRVLALIVCSLASQARSAYAA